MLQQEFEERTGVKVTPEEYHDEIEPIYNFASDAIDKDIFCREWVEHHDSVLLKDLYQRLLVARGTSKQLENRLTEIAHFLITQSDMLEEESLANAASTIISHKEVVKYKLRQGFALTQKDIELILNNL